MFAALGNLSLFEVDLPILYRGSSIQWENQIKEYVDLRQIVTRGVPLQLCSHKSCLGIV